MYDQWGDHISNLDKYYGFGLNDKEITADDTEHNHKYFGQSNVEVTHHIQLR